MFPPPRNPQLELRGLTPAQEANCRSVLNAFLSRHCLRSWGLTVSLIEATPRTWQLEVSVVAPNGFDAPVRMNRLKIDKTLSLARVVDLCLETHYNACMNRKAAAKGAG